ncbi:MAG: protein-glutamate O-methyltransferase CheR [Gemmatimonadales bacterium]|nr:protein-glutamate O-methyltransferase CheR [Gemmatimonadales bacterium]
MGGVLTAPPAEGEREYACTERDYAYFRELTLAHTGIRLAPAKRQMIYSRLARRVRRLGLPDLSAYADRLRAGDAEELKAFVNAMTTNLTSWFRESHHFEHLGREVLPALLAEAREPRRLRLWSCAASTGEEPYSMAMVLGEALRGHPGWDARILATDIDSDVLAHARAGVYEAQRVAAVPRQLAGGAFRRGRGAHEGRVRVRREVAELVAFRQLNLLGPWPMRGPFDVVFCRNVVIYFDKDTQRRLFDRIADLMAPDGWLYLGHSESLFRVCDRFEALGRTIYRRLR